MGEPCPDLYLRDGRRFHHAIAASLLPLPVVNATYKEDGTCSPTQQHEHTRDGRVASLHGFHQGRRGLVVGGEEGKWETSRWGRKKPKKNQRGKSRWDGAEFALPPSSKKKNTGGKKRKKKKKKLKSGGIKAALTASASGGLRRGAARGSQSGRPALPAASSSSSRSCCLSFRPGAAPTPQPRHDPAATRKAKPLGGETRHLPHPPARRGVCAGAEGPRPRRTERCPPGPGAAGSQETEVTAGHALHLPPATAAHGPSVSAPHTLLRTGPVRVRLAGAPEKATADVTKIRTSLGY
ncbi:uncharacterized protein LOC116791717 [Chiroxiphia lanceolata]|uniref:uncharacterized protein LOC116791717 n=1 Tax=Chiroxiphia lanceolata TaxID=296741 RepID=UPI0013CEBC8A|nr:uncharacterized protein LOC116791717 [Chiroxiphia lanceolata]